MADEPGTQENLLGMSQLEFLTYVWESAIVGTGGYYLYYRVNGGGAGLPEHLLNGDADNIVTLLVTYHLTDDVLLDFLNSAVLRDPIRIDDEILYVETLGQTASDVVKVATVPPGNIGFSMRRENPQAMPEIPDRKSTPLNSSHSCATR